MGILHHLSCTIFFYPLEFILATSYLLSFLSTHYRLLLNLWQDGKIPLSRVNKNQVSGQFDFFFFFLGNIPAQPASHSLELVILWIPCTLRAPSLALCELPWIPVPRTPCLLIPQFYWCTASWERAHGGRGRGRFILELIKSWGHCEPCKLLQVVKGGQRARLPSRGIFFRQFYKEILKERAPNLHDSSSGWFLSSR